MFQKGQSGNPSGRPKGSKNKNYLSLRYWFEVIAENGAKMRPERKIEIAMKCAEMLLPKYQNLPADPNDSVENALAREAILGAIESGSLPPIEGQNS